MGYKVQSIIANGSQGTIVDIECHLSNNLQTIIIVGFANKAVDEARERIRGAFASSRIMLPRKRITVNLAPADIPKADSSFDLAIAVAILAAAGEVTQSLDQTQAFIGELGLDGSTRAVRGIIGKILLGRAKGLTTFFIPADNLSQAQLIPEVRLVPIANLGQLYGHLAHDVLVPGVQTGKGRFARPSHQPNANNLSLSAIIDQDQAKRALEITAGGGHNIFFAGPPGTGKSMLAKALASILPPLNQEEALEVTQLHSLASFNYENIVIERPFRAPHHSASQVAIVGGGSRLRPGEISLAHHGVLFFDELPEFSRETLEALRQPLEDHVISLSRARESADYPANFIFVATANPCPCGYHGTDQCQCMPYEVTRYQLKLSGPIIDRIDLYSYVGRVDHDNLLRHASNPQADSEVQSRVLSARARQQRRFSSASKLNATMNNEDIKQHANLTPAAVRELNRAARSQQFSARGYFRTIKVARTIADLEESSTISDMHIAEAIRFRYQPPSKPPSA